jgi:D-alanine transaminase
MAPILSPVLAEAVSSAWMLVHLDGSIVPLAAARISPEDRAFLFADGVYEGLLARRGRLLFWEEHERRLRHGLSALRLPLPDTSGLRDAAEELLRANDLAGTEAAVYLQVSRGAAPRAHAFPDPPVRPTVYLAVRPHRPHPPERLAAGVAAITVADDRWARCDVKSTALVANVLAKQAACEAGAHEALFVRDGTAIEGSHTNLFVVRRDGVLVTCPVCRHILEGVTRNCVLGLARGMGLPVEEVAMPLAGLGEVAEVFVTGTTTEILAVTTIDGRPVADGRPGPLTRRLREAYLRRVDELAPL